MVKAKLDPKLRLARVSHPLMDTIGDNQNGAFMVKAPTGRRLYIIASNGDGWDHVSVSLVDVHAQATPTWEEMCFVKDLFFETEETVIQYHPPRSRYINTHPGCLHLWRPQEASIPLPSMFLV